VARGCDNKKKPLTIQINSPELEALIRERIQTGNFRDVEDMLLHALGVNKSEKHSGTTEHTRRLEKESGVWVLRTGQPLSPTVVDDSLTAIRRERDFGNLGPLR
jgi:hypothetical protein